MVFFFFPRFIIKETLKERFVAIIRAKGEVTCGVTLLFINSSRNFRSGAEVS